MTTKSVGGSTTPQKVGDTLKKSREQKSLALVLGINFCILAYFSLFRFLYFVTKIAILSKAFLRISSLYA